MIIHGGIPARIRRAQLSTPARCARLAYLPAALLAPIPTPVLAQATSPFMTGANALQTNILAWLTPIAVILVMALGAMAMANRMRSEYAARVRAGYSERVAQRLAQSGRVRPAVAPAAAADLDEIRRQARAAWLQLRAQGPAAAPAAARGAEAPPHEPEEDLGR
jgi:hypothetical protein